MANLVELITNILDIKIDSYLKIDVSDKWLIMFACMTTNEQNGMFHCVACYHLAVSWNDRSDIQYAWQTAW